MAVRPPCLSFPSSCPSVPSCHGALGGMGALGGVVDVQHQRCDSSIKIMLITPGILVGLLEPTETVCTEFSVPTAPGCMATQGQAMDIMGTLQIF